MLAAPLWAQPKIEITSPRDGAVVHPGSSITVTVAVSPREAFRTVWILPQQPLKTKSDLMLSAPPYRFTIEVPKDITVADRYGISVSGLLAPGRSLDYGPINIDVEWPDPPLRLEEALGGRLIFANVGESSGLLIYGHFAGGSKVDLTYSSLTKYKSESEAIVKIDSSGMATATGVGSSSITVENNGTKVVIPVSVIYGKARADDGKQPQ
jgi:hypothetical protein